MTVAFVFPGQGSQAVGMQRALAECYPVISETYREASETLSFDLWKLVRNGPAETLDETIYTQPAMLTAGVATWRAWLAEGGEPPAMMAGHSLGEYTALVGSGVLEFTEALSVVNIRAKLMQDAVPENEGAMAAVLGLDDEAIQRVCDSASEIGVAEAVNFNSPGQVVVAGHRKAIERLIALAKDAGARRAIMLAVSVPAHSSLMLVAAEKLSETLDETTFLSPRIPVICAVDGIAYGDGDDIRERIKRQVFSPVRWVATIKGIVNRGASAIIECGPGKVLTGLNRRIERNLRVASFDSPDVLQEELNGVAE